MAWRSRLHKSEGYDGLWPEEALLADSFIDTLAKLPAPRITTTEVSEILGSLRYTEDWVRSLVHVMKEFEDSWAMLVGKRNSDMQLWRLAEASRARSTIDPEPPNRLPAPTSNLAPVQSPELPGPSTCKCCVDTCTAVLIVSLLASGEAHPSSRGQKRGPPDGQLIPETAGQTTRSQTKKHWTDGAM